MLNEDDEVDLVLGNNGFYLDIFRLRRNSVIICKKVLCILEIEYDGYCIGHKVQIVSHIAK